jgi:hypothetical protein
MHRIVASVGALLALGTLSVAAQQPVAPGAPVTTVATTAVKPNLASVAPKLLPGTRTGVFTTIQGNALNATNGMLPNTLVRLRDARFGRIVNTTVSDQSGLFAFRTVDPGSYIVELVAQDDQSVLAASQILNVNAGDVVSAVVKLPFRIPLLAGLLGNTLPSAAAVTTQAAASGLLATAVTQEVSPAR